MATEFFIFDLDFDLESLPNLATENFKTTIQFHDDVTAEYINRNAGEMWYH